MTVKELKEELNQYDDNMEVIVETWHDLDGCQYTKGSTDILNVDYNDENTVVIVGLSDYLVKWLHEE